MNGKIEFWPYVLPFPLEVEKRKLVWRILQSKTGMGILVNLKVDAPTYQKELIQQLPFSNKSIIEYLKKMVEAGILEQGMERKKIRKKTVWVKWYQPTKLGKWLILFLKPPGEISPKVAKKTLEELFKIYSANIVHVCRKYGINTKYFHDVLVEELLREHVEKRRKVRARVVVFGSAALDLYGNVERLPSVDETVYVDIVGVYPGGMGANVAVALARLGVPVAFVGKIGNDDSGRVLLENLQRNGVDVSNVKVESLSSLQTLILISRKGERRLFALGLPNSALSISSPNEIDWELIRKCEIVYIGEVFTEISSTIASYAKNAGKKIVYRPGVPYFKLGIEKLHDTLQHVDILILNEIGWNALQRNSKAKLEDLTDIQAYGPSVVILTKGSEGCEVLDGETRFKMRVPSYLSKRFRVVDPTGAGDSFSAALIKKLLEKASLKEAVYFAQVAAYITCSRMGASPAFPTLKEVEENLR